ncbi:MAG: hypothetical protein CMJ83_11870 [Planctomycetes bacterium]|nr:hypothetical protein [Planctomycetota bacterium]
MSLVTHRAVHAGLVVPCLALVLCAQGFVEITTTAGLVLPGSPVGTLGRGPCIADFDGDGDQDVVFPALAAQPIRHFRNDGNNVFTDVTGVTGLENAPTESHAAVAADIDNDGDLDLFVTAAWTANKLFINDGTGNFTEDATSRGVDAPSSGCFSASFGDYDRDGWIDLYIGNWQAITGGGEANILYRNTGNGYFVDVTTAAGCGDIGLTFTGIWHDYDEDGWPDLFVGNDKGYYPGNQPDTTYRNNGNGTFTDVGTAINTQFAIGAMGADFTDAFNDGGWDIFVSNTSAGHLLHVWNPTTQIYDEQATLYGVVANVEGWAVNFLDYDNDGWQDLYIVHSGNRNHLYRNPGPTGGAWTDVAASVGADIWGVQYTSAIGDLDNDGRIDLVLPDPFYAGRVLRNTVVGGNWIRLRTVGTQSNRDGIGAVVEVTTGTNTQRQTVRCGHGYLGGHDLRVHFGLGTATVADRIKITWPSGQTQILTNVASNQTHVVTEPNLVLQSLPTVGTTSSLSLTSPWDQNQAYAMVLTFSPSPGIPLPDGRIVPANPDWLFWYTLLPGNGLLPQGAGVLSAQGAATSALIIPGDPALVGLTVWTTAVTGNPAAPSAVAGIAGPLPVTFQ